MKQPTVNDLWKFVELTGTARNDYYRKEEYKKLGRKILKYIAFKLGLKKGEFDIRFNPGGIVCSGDHTLHTDNLYVALHDNLNLGWFYFRKCNGRKDYCGEVNQIVYWKDWLKLGIDGFCQKLIDFNAGKTYPE